MQNNTLDQIIDKAIKREEEAYDFYTGLYSTVADKEAKDTLKFLAEEEKKHKAFLVDYKNGKFGDNGLRMTQVVDYAIAQHMDKPDPEKDMQSKDVYLVAAHRELNSYNFYTDLAKTQPDGEVKDILNRMAGEELRHKEKVEYLYSNTAFPQTQGG